MAANSRSILSQAAGSSSGSGNKSAGSVTPLSRTGAGAISKGVIASAIRGNAISNPSVIPLPDEEALKLRSKKKRARAAANTLGASNTILSDTYSGQTLG